MLQKKQPTLHTSCAGRGRAAQEEAFKLGNSKAHYGQSAHNYNCALDLFINDGSGNLWPQKWFYEKLQPEVPEWLDWYGAPGAKFKELPHIEIRGWRVLANEGKLKLVEG